MVGHCKVRWGLGFRDQLVPQEVRFIVSLISCPYRFGLGLHTAFWGKLESKRGKRPGDQRTCPQCFSFSPVLRVRGPGVTGSCDSGQLEGNRGILNSSCLSTLSRGSVPILCSLSPFLSLASSLPCGRGLPVNFFLSLSASSQITG